MELIDRVGGLPKFIQLITLSYSEVQILTALLFMCMEIAYDKRHSNIKNIAVPLTTEIFGFYLLILLYNLWDILILFWEGGSGVVPYYGLRIAMFFSFTVGAFLSIYFVMVVKKQVMSKCDQAIGILLYFLIFMQVVLLLALAVTPFNDFLYSFDQSNVYHRESGFMLWHGVTDVSFVCLAIIIIAYWRIIYPSLRIVLISAAVLALSGFGLSLHYTMIDFNNIVVLIIAFLLFVMYERNRSLYLAEMSMELVETQGQIMVSQIGPHFLFNTLTSIIYYIDKDSALAKKSLMELSKYLRMNIKSLESLDPIQFDEELSHVKKYLELEKLRFGDRLKLEFDIEETDFRIPTLTIQPLVENAVRHGIRAREDGCGSIRISTKNENGTVVITIEDDGVGFDISQLQVQDKTHVGIRNIKMRLEHMVDAKLYIDSTPGKGTKCRILLPKETIL